MDLLKGGVKIDRGALETTKRRGLWRGWRKGENASSRRLGEWSGGLQESEESGWINAKTPPCSSLSTCLSSTLIKASEWPADPERLEQIPGCQVESEGLFLLCETERDERAHLADPELAPSLPCVIPHNINRHIQWHGVSHGADAHSAALWLVLCLPGQTKQNALFVVFYWFYFIYMYLVCLVSVYFLHIYCMSG